MKRPSITAFRTVLAPGVLAWAFAGGVGFGQVGSPSPDAPIDPPRPRRPVTRAEALPPVEAAVGAFLAARTWVDALACPPVGDPESLVEVPGCRGISVTLRHEGRLVGSGEDFAGDADFTRPDGLLLRRAVARAIAKVRGDRAVAALPAEVRGSIGTRLTLEIEFAGDASPLLGRTFAECAARVEPGIDGLALRRGTAFFAAFPGRLLSTGLAGTPGRTLLSLSTEAGFPAKDLSELVALEPVGVYRFRSLRLAQVGPGELPAEVLRSGRLVDPAEVTRERLAAAMSGLLQRVRRTVSRPKGPDPAEADPETLLAKGLALGDYLPVSDEYRPLVANPLDQSMLAFALADVAANAGVAASDRELARSLAESLLVALGSIPKDPADPLAVANVPALITLAVARVGDLPEGPARSLAGRARTACVAPDATGDPALLAAAVATLASRGEVEPALAEAALAKAWAAAPGERQVGAFAWLVLAEETLARIARRPIARAAEFRALAALVLAAQVDAKDPSAPADLVGGVRLGSGRAPVTAQSFRPLLGLEWLRSRAIPAGLSLEAGERDRLAAGRVGAGRFLLQLAVDEPGSRLFRHPARTLGGVRAAAWEADQPVSVQAFGLLLGSALLAPDGVADR
jgi:hypothetical protein